MPKSNCFRATFSSEHIHGSQALPKSAWQHFYPKFPLIKDKLSWKRCLWIRSKNLRLFGNTLIADNMYSPHNWEKFRQRLQTHVSKKGKIIFGIFIAFLKSALNFVYLEKQDQLDSLNSSEVIDSEKCSYFNLKKQLLQNKLREWPHWRVPNTAEICMALLLSEFLLIQDKLRWKIFFQMKSKILGQLTRWRSITCILLIIDRNFRKDFKRKYLKKEKYFL